MYCQYARLKTLVHFLLMLLPATVFSAHGGTISGIILDNENNDFLSGAYIMVVENGRSAVSNELGIFEIRDLEGGVYTLQVTFIGYKPLSLPVQVSDHATANVRIMLESQPLDLSGIEISANKTDPYQTISQLDVLTRPLNSAQEVLRAVPGLFIAQHAGGGKAEQIFLRGFDIDHGTDIAISVDGIPVNMVSHAHGQGYADLHFVVPELIQQVDFQKGTYRASNGNFATAGAVQFHTIDQLKNSFLKIEGGSFDTWRLAGALDLLPAKGTAKVSSAWIGGEGLFSNGYFDMPQDFKRINLMGKYRLMLNDRKILTLSASTFRSSWLASGQIPERAVAAGLIGRFGAIDPTEGGRTGRFNLQAELSTALTDHLMLYHQVFTSRYDFELYSNFTFFLRDPVNGDQIRQKENRHMGGTNNRLVYSFITPQGREWRTEVGIQLRYDDVRENELSYTAGRLQTLSVAALGDVQEINAAVYLDQTIELTDRLNLNAGLRFDQFHYSYFDRLVQPDAWKQATKNQVNPKLNLFYQLNNQMQLFAHGGTGFHSNDTRVILAGDVRHILPRATGWEAGAIARPLRAMLLTFSAWRLGLEQEFVYVGDEGIVEPSGRSLRQGVDLSLRWQPFKWLYLDADYNWSLPRTVDAPEGADHIPLAPVHTSAGGVLISAGKTLQAGMRYRYLADRPANEDNSLVAAGYFLIDAQAHWTPLWKKGAAPCTFFLSIQNALNTEWKEAQFETTSRLFDEAAPVTEIHMTPGSPFFLKGGLEMRF